MTVQALRECGFMFTLRQIEAFYWIVQLGTFERAANRLNTTQSAISKRVQELETDCGTRLFDRSQRSARLTERGESLLVLAEQMLGLQERINNLRNEDRMAGRLLRVGVTELSAQTWLPRLVREFRSRYPESRIRLEVAMSRNLLDGLQDGGLDLIAIPDTPAFDDLGRCRLPEVENAWMARPDLVNADDFPLSLAQIGRHPILVQGKSSGYAQTVSKWMKQQGMPVPDVLSCDSLTALVGLTVAGVGISYMPQSCFGDLIRQGKLIEVPSQPQLPSIPYSAFYRSDLPSSFPRMVAGMMAELADFTRPFQG